MNEPPAGLPEDFPWQPMTRERMEQVLAGIRNAANHVITSSAVQEVKGDEPDTGTAVIADLRAVYHAAEVALGILRPGYVPKSEALDDVRAMMRWLDGDDETWVDETD
jgi:hypothetical protein